VDFVIQWLWYLLAFVAGSVVGRVIATRWLNVAETKKQHRRMRHMRWVRSDESRALGVVGGFLRVGDGRDVRADHALGQTPCAGRTSGDESEPATTLIPVETEPPTTLIPAETEPPTTQIPVETEPPTAQIPAANRPPRKRPPAQKGHGQARSPWCRTRVRPWLRARRRPRPRAVRLDGEGPVGYPAVLHPGRRDLRPNRCPGLVQRRGLAVRAYFTPWRKSSKK